MNKTTSLERFHPTGEDQGGGYLGTLGGLGTVQGTDETLTAYGGWPPGVLSQAGREPQDSLGVASG
jgi:hypothetical protein